MQTYPENINGMVLCPFCDEENEDRARFCILCGNPLPRSKETRFKKRHILFGAIGLILVGAIGYFSMGGFETKLVGKVNGGSSRNMKKDSRSSEFKGSSKNLYNAY